MTTLHQDTEYDPGVWISSPQSPTQIIERCIRLIPDLEACLGRARMECSRAPRGSRRYAMIFEEIQHLIRKLDGLRAEQAEAESAITGKEIEE